MRQDYKGGQLGRPLRGLDDVVGSSTRASRPRRGRVARGSPNPLNRAGGDARPGAGLAVAVRTSRSREAPSPPSAGQGLGARRSQSGADPRERDPAAQGGGNRSEYDVEGDQCHGRGHRAALPRRWIRGDGRRPRAAEGVVHRGPITRGAARACRSSRGAVPARYSHQLGADPPDPDPMEASRRAARGSRRPATRISRAGPPRGSSDRVREGRRRRTAPRP